MKVQLKDFQTDCVAQLYRRFRLAYAEVRGGGDRQAIVLSSPTGSGKTTTLYSAICELYSDETNIMTIEDPVERRISGVNQIQVDPKIQFN